MTKENKETKEVAEMPEFCDEMGNTGEMQREEGGIDGRIIEVRSDMESVFGGFEPGGGDSGTGYVLF